MKPIVKQLAEDLIWGWDFAAKLGGEVIQSVEAVSVTARGRVVQLLPLVIGEQGFAGQKVNTRLDDGTDGESYLVTVRVLNAAGERAEMEAEFLVADLAWIAEDGATPYLTIAEFVTEVGYEESVRLTDELGTGRVDKARLVAAIGAAQATCDGYLAARYTVPIGGSIPQIVKTAVLDMARARLYRGEPPEGVRKAAADAISGLRAIARGEMKLPQAQEPVVAADAPVLFSGSGRTYPAGSLDGY